MAIILPVDDDPDVLELLQTILEPHRHRVLTAENGNKALEIYHVHQNEIDATVTDIRMPVIDGIELALKVKADRSSLPVVVISGLVDRAYIIESGFSPDDLVFIRKPFDLLAVEDTIQGVLESI